MKFSANQTWYLQDLPSPIKVWCSRAFLEILSIQRNESGSETWGLVLGQLSTDQRTTILEQCIPAGDAASMEALIAQWGPASGRPFQGMGLYIQDTSASMNEAMRIFERHFRDAGSVLLLLGARENGERVAQIHMREADGAWPEQAQSVTPLPGMVKAAPKLALRETPKNNPKRAVPQAATIKAVPKSAPRWVSALLLAAGAAPLAWWSIPKPAFHREAPLGLQVDFRGQAVQISWDRNAKAVRKASWAELEVKDGNRLLTRTLRREELLRGSASYAGHPGNLDFHLIVKEPEGSVTDEWLMVVEPLKPGAASAQPTTGGVSFQLPVKGVKSIVPPPMTAVWRPTFAGESSESAAPRRSNGAKLELPVQPAQ